MFQHILLLAYRNFIKFKSTFLINLIGLSTGLAGALLIYLWVADELAIDKFHAKDSRLFQVMLAALVIAWLTVSTQAVKAASVNPATSLKDE